MRTFTKSALALLSLLLVSCSCERCCKYLRYPSKVVSSGADSFKLQVRSTNDPSSLLKLCLDACEATTTCSLVSLQPLAGQCQLYSNGLIADDSYHNLLDESNNATVFVSSCNAGSIKRCNATWSFDVRTALAIRESHITSSFTASSFLECANRCYELPPAECRSVTYKTDIGQCYASKFDRHTSSDAFSRNTHGSVYAERVDIKESYTECRFRTARLPTKLMAETQKSASSLDQCEKQCANDPSLPRCRSFRFAPSTSTCYTSPDDRLSTPIVPESVATSEEYQELDHCLKADVTCSPQSMTIALFSSREVNGKLYSTSTPDCTYDVRRSIDFDINVPLVPRRLCGVIDEGDREVSITMMLQYHSTLMTARDRVFKFICEYNSGSQVIEQKIELNKIPERPGPTPLTGQLPRAGMRIVNGDGLVVSTAEVGQQLYAEVYIRPEDEGRAEGYGIFATDCSATEKGNFVKLIDSKGCPVDPSIFEGFKLVNPQLLRAQFQGFSFEHVQRININCNVNFCSQLCQPASCSYEKGLTSISYGRRRREIRSNTSAAGTSIFMVDPVEGYLRSSIPKDGEVTYSKTPASANQRHINSIPLLVPLFSIAILLVCAGTGLLLWKRNRMLDNEMTDCDSSVA